MLKKALAERMLNGEMDQHLESESASAAHDPPSGNHRNGYTKKTVLTDTRQVELEIPRDRRGTFEPQLIAKFQRRFPGFDDKIISKYARGISVRAGAERAHRSIFTAVVSTQTWAKGLLFQKLIKPLLHSAL